MTFIPYAGTPEDWAAEREALWAQHRLLLSDFVHDNLEAKHCSCRHSAVVPASSRLNLVNAEGRICAGCGGSSFRRAGACMTCNDCATSDGCG